MEKFKAKIPLYRINVVHVETVAKLDDARRDFVEEDTFFSSILIQQHKFIYYHHQEFS
jgi:hypothetical protein